MMAQSEHFLKEQTSEPARLEPLPETAREQTRARVRNAKKKSILRWLRRAIFVVAALLLLAAIVVAWMPQPLPVEVTTVARGPLTLTVDEDGQARVKDRYVVSAPLTGSLARIEFKPGDVIAQGQVLAQIVPLLPPLLDERSKVTAKARLAGAQAAERQVAAQLERVSANVEYARRELVRVRQLFEKGALASAELERAQLAERSAVAELESLKFGSRVAAHEVEMARATLQRMSGSLAAQGEQLEIAAPVAGRVLKVMHESESVVQPGTALLEVGDPAALEIVVDVLTSDAVKISTGAAARIDGWGGEPLEASVRRVEPSAFTRLSALGVEEQRVNVVLDMTSPRERWHALGDGFRVEAHIVTWHADNVLKVPASAIFRRDEGWALYRLEGDVVRLATVTIGHNTGRDVEVLRGVAQGSKVVIHPSDQLKDGVSVRAR